MGTRLSNIGLACGVLAICSLSARGEAGASKNGSVTDVGPEAGLTLGWTQSFFFRGTDEILAIAGRTGLYKSLDRGENWVRQPGVIDSRGVEPVLLGFCQSPSEPATAYYVTVEGGVSRTTNFGESWQPLTVTPMENGGVCAVDPVDPAVVYVLPQFSDEVSQGVLFKSIDGAQSFSVVGSGLPRGDAFGLAVALTSPQTVYVGSSSIAGLYSSRDGGLNFQQLSNSPNFPWAVLAHPTVDGTLLVVTYDDLFLSTDAGETFDRVGAGLPPRSTNFATNLAYDTIDPMVVYATDGRDGLFRSNDGARTFTRIDSLGPDQLRGVGVVSVDVRPRIAQEVPVIYAGTSLGPIRSDDGGKTFVSIHRGYRGISVNDIAVDAASRLLLATSNSVGVFRSTVPGSYEAISDPLPNEIVVSLRAIAAAPDDPDVYVVVGAGDLDHPSGVYRTADGGRSWTRAIIAGEIGIVSRVRIAFAASDSRRVYIVSAFGGNLFRSDDAGESFERVASQSFGSVGVDPRAPDVLYAGSWSNTGLFKSTDGGRSFQQLIARGTFTAIAIDPQRPEVIYAGQRLGTVLRSIDGGQNFGTAAQGLIGDSVLGLGVSPTQLRRVFAWMHAGGLFQSNDGADSWIPADTGEPLRRSTGFPSYAGALAIDQSNPANVYMGTGSVLQFVSR